MLRRHPLDVTRAHSSRFLDLYFLNSGLNVYAGTREVRPPLVPTTRVSFQIE
jgi:hypothetical protein